MPVSLLAALALAACQQPAEKSPEAKPGSGLRAGRLVLPAVKGNPGAAYFTFANSAKAPVTIVAVTVAGAEKAEMHTTEGGKMAAMPTLAVPAGETVAFAPGGKHVMVFGLDPKIAAGGSAQVTLTFEGGEKHSAPLAVETAGGDMDIAH
ncbi:MAG: copper chaperone PCu(A)C [Novosphingobium sp.]